MTCLDFRHEMAVALLSRRPLTVEAAAHLETCQACAKVQAELAPVPGLLALAPVVTTSDPPDERLLDRLLDAVMLERRQRRRRTRLVTAVSAAALVLAVTTGVVVHGVLSSVPGTSSTVLADVRLHALSAGATQVDVAVSGLPIDVDCTVVAVGADGSRHDVVTWTADYEGHGHAQGVVPLAPSDVVTVELTDAHTGHVFTTVRTAPVATTGT